MGLGSPYGVSIGLWGPYGSMKSYRFPMGLGGPYRISIGRWGLYGVSIGL